MLRPIWLCIGVFVLYAAAARATVSKRDNHSVKWFEPTIERPVDATHARILLRGVTQPKTTIRIEKGAVAIFHGKQISDLTSKNLNLKSSEVKAGSDGKFQVSMTLPYTHVEIPISATATSSHVEHYVLLMNVRQHSVELKGGDIIKAPTKWELNVGPSFEFLNLSQSNSAFSWRHGSVVVGTHVGADFSINAKNTLSAGVTSLQGVGSLPSGSSYTYSDFEYILGFSHRLNLKPTKHTTLAANLFFTGNNSPIIGRDTSSVYTFTTATLNYGGIGVNDEIPLSRRAESNVGLGFLYGEVGSGGIHMTSNLVGGYIKYFVSYKLSQQFFLFGDISGQYETFQFTAYDPPTSTALKNTINQTIITSDAGIQCRF